MYLYDHPASDKEVWGRGGKRKRKGEKEKEKEKEKKRKGKRKGKRKRKKEKEKEKEITGKSFRFVRCEAKQRAGVRDNNILIARVCGRKVFLLLLLSFSSSFAYGSLFFTWVLRILHHSACYLHRFMRTSLMNACILHGFY